MSSWRTLMTLAVALSVATSAHAQGTVLKEDLAPGTCTRVELSMALSGELKLQQEGKAVALKQSASARHDFAERVLEAGDDGASAKSARHYKTAKVTIEVASDKTERELRPERCFIVSQRVKDALLTYSPKGSLTRDDLQLTEHLDTLAVTGLLPGREVAVNDTWKIPNGVAQALCHFEGLSGQELTGKLTEVKDGVAVFSVTGTASGIDLGAAVKVTVSATGRFDVKARRLVGLTWKQNDEREQGPVSPASAVEITYTLTRSAVETPPELTDYALVPVPAGAVPEALTLLAYKDPAGRYKVQHAREWQLVGRTDEHLVLRLMERGEFIAQATLTPWKKLRPGQKLTGDEFKEIIAGTPGWSQERVIEADAVKADAGANFVYRVAAEGTLDGTKALQFFYYVAGPQGDQLLIAFTMAPSQAQKLGTRDLALVRQAAFPEPPPAAGAAPGK